MEKKNKILLSLNLIGVFIIILTFLGLSKERVSKDLFINGFENIYTTNTGFEEGYGICGTKEDFMFFERVERIEKQKMINERSYLFNSFQETFEDGIYFKHNQIKGVDNKDVIIIDNSNILKFIKILKSNGQFGNIEKEEVRKILNIGKDVFDNLFWGMFQDKYKINYYVEKSDILRMPVSGKIKEHIVLSTSKDDKKRTFVIHLGLFERNIEITSTNKGYEIDYLGNISTIKYGNSDYRRIDELYNKGVKTQCFKLINRK